MLAASLRWVTLAVLVGFVVRDILRPELDVVRRTYGDDPDGGDFDGAPDALELARPGATRHRCELRRTAGRPRSPDRAARAAQASRWNTTASSAHLAGDAEAVDRHGRRVLPRRPAARSGSTTTVRTPSSRR